MFLCNISFDAQAQNRIASPKLKTVVLDPGHGGRDPGTMGKYMKEKNVTLGVALKLGEMITEKFPDIKVVYTRKTDKHVDLHERGNIANRNNADLFISIHVDGFKKSTVQGVSTWVMGLHKSNANMDVAQRENSVITMEDDYTSKYSGFDPKSPESYIMFSLLQNAHLEQSIKYAELVQKEMIKNGPLKTDRGVRQAGFIVLWKTTMPSILIEMGFLTNPSEENILAKKDNQTKIARNIFNAFCKYKQQYEADCESVIDERPIQNISESVTIENNTPLETSAQKKSYGVQIMASPKKVSTAATNFKGQKNVKRIKDGNLYKYIAGNTNSLNEAKRLCKSLQKNFKGAFVVEIIDGDKLKIVK